MGIPVPFWALWRSAFTVWVSLFKKRRSTALSGCFVDGAPVISSFAWFPFLHDKMDNEQEAVDNWIVEDILYLHIMVSVVLLLCAICFRVQVGLLYVFFHLVQPLYTYWRNAFFGGLSAGLQK